MASTGIKRVKIGLIWGNNSFNWIFFQDNTPFNCPHSKSWPAKVTDPFINVYFHRSVLWRTHKKIKNNPKSLTNVFLKTICLKFSNP